MSSLPRIRRRHRGTYYRHRSSTGLARSIRSSWNWSSSSRSSSSRSSSSSSRSRRSRSRSYSSKQQYNWLNSVTKSGMDS